MKKDLEALFEDYVSDPEKDRTDAEWQRVSKPSTVYLKWDRPGYILEGVWLGTIPGKYGPEGQVDSDGNLVVFKLHTVLLRALESVEMGTKVRILYDGLRVSQKSGREFKAFSVYTR